MPSAAIQSRILAFESLGSSTSTNTVHDNNLLEEPISPTADSFFPIAPSQFKKFNNSPSPSPPNLGTKTSLIDLRDWVVDDDPANRNQNPRRPDVSEQSSAPSPLLISLEAPLKTKSAPPLPPKKKSYNSFNGVNGVDHPNGRPSVTSNRSESLTVDYMYPPSLSLDTSILARSSGHVPSSSVSSFHSVSLSDSESTALTPTDRDGAEVSSLDESFEKVSAISSPITSIEWGGRENTLISTKSVPPKLPDRPKPRPSRSPVHSPPPSPIHPQSSGRRMPPPPPRSNQLPVRPSLASSDRSSMFTSASRTSSIRSTQSQSHITPQSQLSRPAPLPPAAKQRYESVFLANIQAKRKAEKTASTNIFAPPSIPTSAAARHRIRKAAGWRGLSVDLITNPVDNALSIHDTGSGSMESVDSNESDGSAGIDERLDGYTVQRLWSCSKLERSKLRNIWDECDPNRSGFLDMDAFVKGMWRIDEQLRKARLNPRLAVSSIGKRPPRTIN